MTTAKIAALEEAVKEIQPQYERSIEFFDEQVKKFFGMNDARPVKSAGVVLFENARAHLRLLKAIEAGEVRILPCKLSGNMWSKSSAAFELYANQYRIARTVAEALVARDVAPQRIYDAMLSAAEPFDFGEG